MPDEAELASEREQSLQNLHTFGGSDVDDYERRVAKDIVMMLRETGADAQHVLALVNKMLNVKLPGDNPPPTDAA